MPTSQTPGSRWRNAAGYGLLALVLTAATGDLWSILLLTNLHTSPALPWSVGVMALLLGLLWRYLGGHGAPRRTAATRRHALRARLLPLPLFAWAVGAGLLAIIALAGFWIVLVRLVPVPRHALPAYTHYPPLTVALVLGMAALSGAVAEEAGFRGYLQGALERVVGGPAAIVLVAVVMAPAHALTQGLVQPIVLFYLCVDGMLGLSAYLTQSILPGLVVHGLGLLTFFALIWPGDATRPLVRVGGMDPWFWLHVAQALGGTVLALAAFGQVARLSRPGRAPLGEPVSRR